MLWLPTIIKYSFSTKNVISECFHVIDKTHQQQRNLFLLLNSSGGYKVEMPIHVAETKTLVVHLLNYEALKISFYFIHANFFRHYY